MTRMVFVMLLGLTAVFAQNARKLTSEDIDKHLDRKDVFWLDVRSAKEIETGGSVKGYVNIPLAELEARLGEIPKDKTVVTICAHGVRSGKAAVLLEKNGYKVAGFCGLAEYTGKSGKVGAGKKSS